MKSIIRNIFKKRLDFVLIFLLITFSFIIRTYLLDKIPTNLTGDESWDLSNIYRISFGTDTYPLTLLGDGSVPAILFYPVALAINFFGTSLSIIFLRLNIVMYSLFALIGFYLILEKSTSKLIAFLFTILLSSNYVFLNFSRTAWVNMAAVFSGLFLIFYIEKAIKNKKDLYYLLAGIFAGISFYSYHYGRVLVCFIIAYLIIKLLKNFFRKDLIRGFMIFFTTLIVVIIPFLTTSADKSIFRRPEATFAFSQSKITGKITTIPTVFLSQLKYTLKGFLLLDETVMGRGIENQRYVPLGISPVNNIIKFLFWGGLIYFVVKRKYLIWWMIILSVLITQILSDLPPNFSRGLFYIPAIYFISGVFTYKALIYIINLFKLNIHRNFIYLCLLGFTIFAAIKDIDLYFTWMNTPNMYNMRQPAISYEEFPYWQNYQINIIKYGGYPIVNQQWYVIRDNVINNNEINYDN